jgi:ribonuclease D
MKKTAPKKSETALLDPFNGLTLEQILIPRTVSELAAATEEILASGVAGFDTESKPTFKVGEKSKGPHIVQFALENRAFIFQLSLENCKTPLIEILKSDDLLKVGFGLNSDRGHIRRKLGITMRNVLDLNRVFREQGYPGAVGVRAAVGIVLEKKFHKSKRATTSNWARLRLSNSQLLYAANDAFAALKVFQGLNLHK